MLEYLDIFYVYQISHVHIGTLSNLCEMFSYENFGETNVTNQKLNIVAGKLQYSAKRSGQII